MDINFEEELMFTGGRDGAMFMTKLGENYSDTPYQKIFQTESIKQQITCLKYDAKHGKMWYGTPQSSFNCLDLT